jgi:FtsZ-binding cell division protein ZapB
MSQELQDKLKANVMNGFYQKHEQGGDLLAMDLQETIGTCNEEMSTLRHENESLTKEVNELKEYKFMYEGLCK